MQCDYFDAGTCRSCRHLTSPYDRQLAAKEAAVRGLLAAVPDAVWAAPAASPEGGFRAKAKMVVGGAKGAPTFGILDPAGEGVDLRGCRLLGPATATALPIVAEHVAALGLTPYDVPRRTGELKHCHLVENERGELMLRFVLRSEGQLGKLRRGLPGLREALAAAGTPAVVVTANLLAEHVAVTEGAVEVLLTEQGTLPLRVGDVRLRLHPGAFLQTNGPVAAELYRQGAAWIGEAAPRDVLDLYCGVGGFALHAAGEGRRVHGIEVTPAAIAGAREAAAELATERGVTAEEVATFEVGDATDGFAARLAGGATPDLVVVNPPRRGIGDRLAGLLEDSGVPTVLYSSCNPRTLAADLAAMPSLRPVRARLFDMFPHTDHAEVLTLLRR